MEDGWKMEKGRMKEERMRIDALTFDVFGARPPRQSLSGLVRRPPPTTRYPFGAFASDLVWERMR
jgi:hypothetical protein